jgi:hypothetical protein
LAIGKAAGLVIEKSKLSDTDKQNFLKIVNKVSLFTPQTNETFEVTWENAAKEEITILIENGKVKDDVGVIIVKCIKIAGKGIDLAIKKKSETEIKIENVKAAVSGVIDGIESVIKPINTMMSARNNCKDIDYEAYFILDE